MVAVSVALISALFGSDCFDLAASAAGLSFAFLLRMAPTAGKSSSLGTNDILLSLFTFWQLPSEVLRCSCWDTNCMLSLLLTIGLTWDLKNIEFSKRFNACSHSQYGCERCARSLVRQLCRWRFLNCLGRWTLFLNWRVIRIGTQKVTQLNWLRTCPSALYVLFRWHASN